MQEELIENNPDYKELKQEIINVLIFYDLFEFAPTALEVWRFLGIPAGFDEVFFCLESGELGEAISGRNGFYCLKGRDNLFAVRQQRYNISNEKIKKALRAARVFRFLPWIKLIAIGNIIGSNNTRAEGDIDLFIIVKNGRIWVTRFFCVLISIVLGWRPNAKTALDKICLSFFVSEDELNLKNLILPKSEKSNNQNLKPSIINTDNWKLEIGNWKLSSDIYFIYWLASLAVIYDIESTAKRFFEKNGWIKNYLPNWKPGELPRRFQAGSAAYLKVFKIFISIFGMMEKTLRSIQFKLLPPSVKCQMNQDSRIVVNDNMLKFHINDRREEYRALYINKVNSLRDF
jgi:hypothetical protein